jgi:hypothetical protein
MFVKWPSVQVTSIHPGTQQPLRLQLSNPQRTSHLRPSPLGRSSLQISQPQHLCPPLRERTQRYPLLLLSCQLLPLPQPLKTTTWPKAMPPRKNTSQPPPYHLRVLPTPIPPQATHMTIMGPPQEVPRFRRVGSPTPILIINREALLLLALLLLLLLGLVLGLSTKSNCSNYGAGPKG